MALDFSRNLILARDSLEVLWSSPLYREGVKPLPWVFVMLKWYYGHKNYSSFPLDFKTMLTKH